MTISSDFPVLDADRTTDTAEVGRHICDVFAPLEPRIPETDDWVAMPLRLAYSQAAGWYLEVGPYDLDRADIEVLRAAITAYDAAVGRR
jgi:hypothetical protein